MRQKTINIYQFNELNDDAKEKARVWWRESLSWDEWWRSVYEDAENVHLQITRLTWTGPRSTAASPSSLIWWPMRS